MRCLAICSSLAPKAMHLEVGQYAAEKKPDILVAVGKDAAYYARGAASLGKDRVLIYEKREDFEKELGGMLRPGDVVLVKASRGMEMDKIVREILKDKE